MYSTEISKEVETPTSSELRSRGNKESHLTTDIPLTSGTEVFLKGRTNTVVLEGTRVSRTLWDPSLGSLLSETDLWTTEERLRSRRPSPNPRLVPTPSITTGRSLNQQVYFARNETPDRTNVPRDANGRGPGSGPERRRGRTGRQDLVDVSIHLDSLNPIVDGFT